MTKSRIETATVTRSHAPRLRSSMPAAVALFAGVFCIAAPVHAGRLKIIDGCPPDAVLVGQTCIDKYEASVWSIPDPTGTNAALVKNVRSGKADLADLTAAGATLVSPSVAPCGTFAPYPATFPANGQWTAPLYAVSVAGVQPAGCTSWFQADQACALSGKRLITNAEWQRAAAGTPDPGTDNGTTNCNISSTFASSNTGSRSDCESSWGAVDMVGNVVEWVADWMDRNIPFACTTWPSGYNGDASCFGGDASTGTGSDLRLPGAVLRGGGFYDGASAGVFNGGSYTAPVLAEGAAVSAETAGFRCAR